MISYTLALFFLIMTPGPGVLAVASIGAAYGWNQGLSYIMGLWVGINIVCFLVVTGITTFVLASPIFKVILFFISSAYLIYLALTIALKNQKIELNNIKSVSFFSAFLFMLINPKAYIVIVTALSSFPFYTDNQAIETTLKIFILNIIFLPIHFCWLYVGLKINRLNLKAKTQRRLNIFLALCILLAVLLAFISNSHLSNHI